MAGDVSAKSVCLCRGYSQRPATMRILDLVRLWFTLIGINGLGNGKSPFPAQIG